MAKTAKRPDGRFQRQVYLGRINGKRQYKVVYGKTEKEVEKLVKTNDIIIIKIQKTSSIDYFI